MSAMSPKIHVSPVSYSVRPSANCSTKPSGRPPGSLECIAGTRCTVTSPTVNVPPTLPPIACVAGQAERVHPFIGGDDLRAAALRDRLRVERVVVVRVRDENRRRPVAREILQRIGRARIAADERIDEQRRAAGRGDLERRMAEPADGDLAGVRWPAGDSRLRGEWPGERAGKVSRATTRVRRSDVNMRAPEWRWW